MDNKKIVLAAYGIPGIMALESLFGLGILPHNIAILSHQSDVRNAPLWSFAEANHIPIVDHPTKSDAAWEWLKAQKPKVLFSLHYRNRIPQRLLNIPALGCVNLHPSLLPKYKGTFSAPWVIINGETETGFTYHYMVEDFDAGRIVHQQRVPIHNTDTGFSLFHRLIVEAMAAFHLVFQKVVVERDAGVEQTGEGSYYSRDLPYGGIIDPDWDEMRIERFIRAMIFPPLKGAMIKINNELYEVLSIENYHELMRQK